LTSWIVTIGRQFPHHWDRAVEHGLWDTRRGFDLHAGDRVYFWLSGEGLVGQATATSDLFGHTVADGPWDDAQSGNYRHRFRMQVDADHPPLRPTGQWRDIAKAIGTQAGLNTAPIAVHGAGETWLERLFEAPMPPVPTGFWDSYDDPEALVPTSGDIVRDLTTPQELVEIDPHRDDRERVKMEIALRQGQGRFRRSLLAAYEGCAVTGCTATWVLEAAHISPYRGPHTNEVQNGLLLRADVHTLFDLHLLTVVPQDLTIRVAPEARGSDYAALDGHRLRVPQQQALAPNASLLEQHNHECRWLRFD
jgi:putative restriction endonuclease